MQQYSSHEFGNRVGFWRLLEVLDRYNIRCSTTLSIGVLEHFPEVAEAMLKRDWTFVNHGFYNTRYVTTYSEEQEREFLQECVETFKRLTGRQIKGHSGPAASNTERTPDLLAEAGFLYQTDWKIDDQPLPIKVRSGRLVCVPYTSEMNDAPYTGTTTRRTTTRKSAKPSSTSSTRRDKKTVGACASPSIPTPQAGPIEANTWTRCCATSCPMMACGRPLPTRSRNTIWPTTTTKP